jgi:hypothetical protein
LQALLAHWPAWHAIPLPTSQAKQQAIKTVLQQSPEWLSKLALAVQRNQLTMQHLVQGLLMVAAQPNQDDWMQFFQEQINANQTSQVTRLLTHFGQQHSDAP